MAEPGEKRGLLLTITDALRIPRAVVPHIRRFGFSGALVVTIIVLMIFGITPITIITNSYDPPRPWTSKDNIPAADAPAEDLERYMDAVFREARRGWINMFLVNGIGYIAPSLDFISEGTEGPCGYTRLPYGPAYCAEENALVVDLDAYARLARANGEAGHMAQAYLLAHAYGVQVQTVLQRLSSVGRRREALTEMQRDVFDYQLQLQPHCMAGIWAAWAGLPNITENREIIALVGQAEALRDSGIDFDLRPSINEQTDWFTAGYDLPVPGECDPFNNLPDASAVVV
ncbi:neutral zinc metallopeptidase [Pelagibacterium halotolerans]|uniref:neutral zinc metallopeptidase n=1 Tax=Pelagibacterium halotolerans TaxID=531813 RepID=UPI00384BCCCA